MNVLIIGQAFLLKEGRSLFEFKDMQTNVDFAFDPEVRFSSDYNNYVDNKVIDDSSKALELNGTQSNGKYSFFSLLGILRSKKYDHIIVSGAIHSKYLSQVFSLKKLSQNKLTPVSLQLKSFRPVEELGYFDKKRFSKNLDKINRILTMSPYKFSKNVTVQNKMLVVLPQVSDLATPARRQTFSRDDVRFGYLGPLKESFNVDQVIELHKYLLNSNSQRRVVMAGEGPKLDLVKSNVFLDYFKLRNLEDKYKFYSNIEVLVFPMTDLNPSIEVTSFLIEALAFGKIIIIAKNPFFIELVDYLGIADSGQVRVYEKFDELLDIVRDINIKVNDENHFQPINGSLKNMTRNFLSKLSQ